jgi:hypothetical protein
MIMKHGFSATGQLTEDWVRRTVDTVTWSMASNTESVFCSMPMSDKYQVVNAKDYLRSK